MSLYGALFAGVSGLSSEASAMGAISDNVTNVNTIGYKGTKVNFQTLITKQVSTSKYSAGGVQSKPRQNVDLQGLLQSTSSSTDIGVSGKGMLIVNSAAKPTSGQMFSYTRAGSFKVDREGYLQNVGGQYMQGWPLLPWDNSAQSVQVQVGNDVYMKAYKTGTGTTSYVNDNIVSSDHLKPLNLNEMGGTAQQTRNIRLGANLPSGDAVGETHKTNVLVYDSLGNPANLQYTWAKTAVNAWDLEVLPPLGATSLVLQNSSSKVYSAMGRVDFLTEPEDGESFTIKAGTNAAGTAATTYTFNYQSATDDLTDTQGTNTDQTYNIDPTTRTKTQTIDDTVTAVNHALNMAYPGLTATAVPTGVFVVANQIRFTNAAGTNTDVTLTGTTLTQTIADINASAATSGVYASNVGGKLALSTTSSTAITISNLTGTPLTNANVTTGAAVTVIGTTYAERLASTDSIVFRQMSTANNLQVNLNGTATTYSKASTLAAATLVGGAGNLVLKDSAGATTTIALVAADTISTTAQKINAAMQGLGVTATGSGTTGLVLSSDATGWTVDATSTAATLTALGLTAAAAWDTTTFTSSTFTQKSVTQPFSIGAIDTTLAPSSTSAMTFNGDGTPASINVDSVSISWANGAKDQTGSDKMGQFLGNLNISDGMTQFAGSYQIAYINQNGAAFGNFAGVSIGSDGIVTALFDNGVTRPVYQIPVATFVNPNAMESLTGNMWLSTDGSGLPTLRTPGDAGAGTLNAGSLESSTVDLGEEFTAMITTQRAYSAAAKIITTADQMLDELVQIKR